MSEIENVRRALDAAEAYRVYYVKLWRLIQVGEPLPMSTAILLEPIAHVGPFCIGWLLEDDDQIPELIEGDIGSMAKYLGHMYGRAELLRRLCVQRIEEIEAKSLPNIERASILRDQGLEWKAIAFEVCSDEGEENNIRRAVDRLKKEKAKEEAEAEKAALEIDRQNFDGK